MATKTSSATAAKAFSPTRLPFMVAECSSMADAGLLTHNDRVELLDGHFILMPQMGNWHAARVDFFTN